MNQTPEKHIDTSIIILRGQKVILDRDLAVLYEVETRALKQAVKRNIERFPKDFMFELTDEEFSNWRSQFVTSNAYKMGLRYAPMAFTEHGVAMLSSVLKSDKAIQINIMIMRAFVRMREVFATHKDILQKISELEKRSDKHDKTILEIINTLKKLLPIYSNKPKIGY